MKRTNVASADPIGTGQTTLRWGKNYETHKRDGGRFNKRRPLFTLIEEDLEESFVRPLTLARTKSLFLAAVRVWELKRGLRE